jgi:hypothetical protein
LTRRAIQHRPPGQFPAQGAEGERPAVAVLGVADQDRYILDWDEVRAAPDPRAEALKFARSAFRHACQVCRWDTELAATAEGRPPPIR